MGFQVRFVSFRFVEAENFSFRFVSFCGPSNFFRFVSFRFVGPQNFSVSFRFVYFWPKNDRFVSFSFRFV